LARKCGIAFNISYKTTSFEMVRSLVAHGHGYSILNQRATLDRTFDGKQVSETELADRLPAINLVLAQVAGTRQSKRSRAFVESCRRFFEERRGTI
jgi:DNA-binding transcriptional LysR family regulator